MIDGSEPSEKTDLTKLFLRKNIPLNIFEPPEKDTLYDMLKKVDKAIQKKNMLIILKIFK